MVMLDTMEQKVRYACEALDQPSISEVIAFLKNYGVVTNPRRERFTVSTMVESWRKERGLGDTGDLPRLSDEILTELERGRAGEKDDVAAPAPAEDHADTATTAKPVDHDADTVTIASVKPADETNPANPAAEAVTPAVDETISVKPADDADAADAATAATPAEESVSAKPEDEVDTGIAVKQVVAGTAIAVRPVIEVDTVTEQAPPQTGETPRRGRRSSPEGSRGFYLVAFMSLLVSVDTSWRFFGTKLGITSIPERAAMFAVVEVALIACGFAMRAGIRSHSGKPGPARLILWALCAASGYMAFDLAGPVSGLARVALGPVLGVVMLHLALGIELRHARLRVTTWARVSREVKERFLSRLGLGDDERDALARTRDRAARRAAHLARASWLTPFRKARLGRALRAANAAHDDRMRSRLMAELAAVQHADELRRLDLASPWSDSLSSSLKYLKR